MTCIELKTFTLEILIQLEKQMRLKVICTVEASISYDNYLVVRHFVSVYHLCMTNQAGR